MVIGLKTPFTHKLFVLYPHFIRYIPTNCSSFTHILFVLYPQIVRIYPHFYFSVVYCLFDFLRVSVVEKNKEKLVVVKHNDLIKSAYKLSLIESRIVLSCIAQVNSKGTISHLDKFSVSVEDIADLLEAGDDSNMYVNLKSALVRLSERWVTFIEPSSRSGERNTRWVHSVDYVPQSGCIDLFFAPFIIPFLSEIKDNFTQYKLEHVLNLKSSYGVRLYEILKSSMSNEITLTVEWLKETLELPSAYQRIDHLKDRVLNPAVNEINKKTDMTVSYEQIKSGRNITAFKFVFVLREEKKTTKKSAIKKEKPILKSAPIDNLAHFVNSRRRFGDKAPIPEDVKAEMKAKGLW